MTESKVYEIKAKYVDVLGTVYPARYGGDRWALAIEEFAGSRPEVLSINLAAYGIEQPAGFIHVGTYSEHEGLPEALEAVGLATKVGDAPVAFGPYDATAWLMKLSDEVVALVEKAKEARA